MNKLLISIIIPTYNRAWCIGRAIDSCLNQTYQNFEIVITDDGSTDNTEEIVKSYNSNKIRYFKFNENKGVIKARNNSIINSKGEWILLFDSDDELNPNCLEIFVENINKLNNDKIKIVFAHFKNSTTGTTKVSQKFQDIIKENRILTYRDFICSGVAIGDPLPLVNKEVFKQIPYDTHVKRNMAVIWHQFFKISDVLVIDHYLGVCHTEGNDRITKNVIKDTKLWIDGIKEYLNIFEKDILSNCPKAISLHYRSLGIYNFFDNKIQESRKNFIKALRYNPTDYKSLIYLFLTFNKKIFLKIANR